MNYNRQQLFKLSALLLTIQLLSLTSCDNRKCCDIIDTNVQILYKTSTGENLINSSSDFSAENIKIYYKTGNEFKYIYEANLDSPNMHFIDSTQNGDLILTIFPSDDLQDNFSTTLVQLNEQIADTLLCEFSVTENSLICRKAWLNGVPMPNRFLEVVK